MTSLSDMEPKGDIKATLTPPASEEADKGDDSGSELSDLDLEPEDNGEILPDHYYDGGKIPVFKPTMDQFRSFKSFISKIDKYGMKSGIVKVIPPKEWRDSLPSLDEQVKTVKVKNPITQEFHGTHGTYTQANIEKQRSYNLPQWKALSEESNHQPPAKRGERRRNQEKNSRSATTRTRRAAAEASAASKRGPGRPRVRPLPTTVRNSIEDQEEAGTGFFEVQIPPTPTSPPPKSDSVTKEQVSDEEDVAGIKPKGRQPKKKEGLSEEEDATLTKPKWRQPAKKVTLGDEEIATATKTKGRQPKKKEVLSDEDDPIQTKPKGRQPKSVSSRRQHNRRDQADVIDEEAFKDFDYRVYNQADWTPERCAELEVAYWKSLTFNNPMYGADMPGSLFDDSTESWNVAKLENLLDVLGQKVPGVNTAYLYLGMWKASFAWHLEDVDLYSINYIHFGAPKQWYSISQIDARRFEAAMKNVWPNDAKNCDQFLRHKTYLISPQLLQSQYNIHVNRLVHHEGEFVITFPYGYHSGYNLGYNCAESVNFATEAWLDYGKVAKKCNCEADSVWIDVHDVERKLRGEQTPEYYEETDDEEDEEEEEEDEDEEQTNLPTPPGSVKGKQSSRGNKRKREAGDKDPKAKVKRLRIRIKLPAVEPCILCPNDNPYEELLPTDNGKKAHRRCALYTPETYIAEEDDSERICDVDRIDKARLELKCNFCRNKRGSVFQCSQKKCTRAYHATCAAPGGVQVDIGKVPVYAEDGTEYTDIGIDFRCRFHRIKRGKNVDGAALEENIFIRKNAQKVSMGELVQMQYLPGEIFAGVVLENRKSEQTVLVDVLPKREKVEVEYKWLLFFDPVNSQLPVPSENAKPLPAHLASKSRTTAENPAKNEPKADEPFGDPQSKFVWSEFNTCKPFRNPNQVNVDIIEKRKQLWFYLGRTSTEARAQYTENPAVKLNNPEANFLESVRAATTAIALSFHQRRSYPAPYPAGANMHAASVIRAKSNFHHPINPPKPQAPKEKPYNGKYAILDPAPYIYKPKVGNTIDPEALRNQRAFQQSLVHSLPQFPNPPSFRAPSAPMNNNLPPMNTASRPVNTVPGPMNTASRHVHAAPPPPNASSRPMNTTKAPISAASRPMNTAPVATDAFLRPMKTAPAAMNAVSRPMNTASPAPVHPFAPIAPPMAPLTSQPQAPMVPRPTAPSVPQLTASGIPRPTVPRKSQAIAPGISQPPPMKHINSSAQTAERPTPPIQQVQQQRKPNTSPMSAPRPQPQAPVANMMGGSVTPITIPFTRPSSSHQSSPASVTASNTTIEDICDPVIAKYPYLHAAHKQRPKVYQSPYASEGGFTMSYLPNPKLPPPHPTKASSLSEDFLMKRTSSQQEILRDHKRKLSEEKIRYQRDQPQRHQLLTQKPASHLTHQHPSPTSFFSDQNYHYDYPTTYQNSLHHSPQESYFDTSHSLPDEPHDSSLQFQSSLELQMQLQREAQQQEWNRAQESGYNSYYRYSASGSGAHGHGGGNGNSGSQGSPLKYEMDGGGEMLPVMRDT